MDQCPKLRPLNLRWTQVDGQQVLALQDPLRLVQSTLMMPGPLAPFLGLLDGSRDANALAAGFTLRTGASIPVDRIESFIETLDQAFLLENQRFFDARQSVLSSYHSAPFRIPALAGSVYPEDSSELQSVVDQYCEGVALQDREPTERVVGVISPHIDFARGWRTYARTWQLAKRELDEARLVIMLGTDHAGSADRLTLTRQSYATPWGVLPTDIEVVDRLAGVIGEELAYDEEIHHIGEHSIELAAVWLHYVLGGQPKPLVPILCGHHGGGLSGGNEDVRPLRDALNILTDVAAEPGVMVVAAGDVSHVGPAFGDPAPIDVTGKDEVRSSDERWLETACLGENVVLGEYLLRQGDPTRICGAAPIHHMVTILAGAKGRVVDYDQCPADQEFGSLVSIAGALFTT